MKRTAILLCVLVLIAFSYGVVPAAAPDKDVIVTNTSANPVPITGNVSITNTSTLQPFRWSSSFIIQHINNDQQLVTTVPTGKRLVIEYISWWASVSVGNEIVFAGVRSPEFGTFYGYIQINPPHPSADSSFIIQDGSQTVKLSFEAGEDVWVSASRTGGTSAQFNYVIQGYLVTP